MSIDRLERRLPEVLTELSLPGMPDYVDNLLLRTERMPQRPGWSFPERWFPVSTITATLSARRPASLRPLIILAVLAALVAGAVLIYVGAQNRLPPPFGPARNGLVVTNLDGDIITIDPATARSSVLVAGDKLCCVTVAPDGRHLSYLEIPIGSDDPSALHVATMDGKPAGEVRAPFLADLSWVEWSAKGNRFLMASASTIAIFDLGTGQTTTLAVSVPYPVEKASWIGTSDDLLISARRPPAFGGESVPVHLYRWSSASAKLDEIATLEYAVEAPALSPDGARAAYFIWGPTDELHGRVHVFDLATKDDMAITAEDVASNADPHNVEGVAWSPDSSSVLSIWLRTEHDQLAIIPAGGGEPSFIGPEETSGGFGQGTTWRFSPDGKSVLIRYGDQDLTLLAPVSGGESQRVQWSIGGDIDWQRLAP